MIEYRPFRNADPPQIVKLWNACELGRGAAKGFATDAFDALVLAEPYWDPRGLIVARDDSQIVGFAHAGFGPDSSQSRLSRDLGIVCAVMVHPDYRRQGIGRQLIARAEQYLIDFGAKTIEAGESPDQNPFYLGLYGGSNSPGFLQSDINAAPFMEHLGYQPAGRYLVYQRDISRRDDPFDVRLVGIRRKMQLAVSDQPAQKTWWWSTRQGRFDSIRFLLQPKDGGEPVAEVGCWGLDLFMLTWHERAVGFTRISVPEEARRLGYAKTIVLEAIRRLREEMVTRVEMQVLDSNLPTISLLESLKFEQIDEGIVYAKRLTESHSPTPQSHPPAAPPPAVSP